MQQLGKQAADTLQEVRMQCALQVVDTTTVKHLLGDLLKEKGEGVSLAPIMSLVLASYMSLRISVVLLETVMMAKAWKKVFSGLRLVLWLAQPLHRGQWNQHGW